MGSKPRLLIFPQKVSAPYANPRLFGKHQRHATLGLGKCGGLVWWIDRVLRTAVRPRSEAVSQVICSKLVLKGSFHILRANIPIIFYQRYFLWFWLIAGSFISYNFYKLFANIPSPCHCPSFHRSNSSNRYLNKLCKFGV